MNKFIKKILKLNSSRSETAHLIMYENAAARLLIGRMIANLNQEGGIRQSIHEVEFKVFSQYGDDGIIQYLIHHTRPEHEAFIEFGAGDYSEANTRFLLLNNNWRGLIIDGNQRAMQALKREEIYWRYDLTTVGAFITRENINQLFEENGFSGEIGILSIDVDGNDYWIWEGINCVNPAIVVVEYNSVFGAKHSISIPYDPSFIRTRAHFSNLFWGASLKALCTLADRKGYAFIGSNSAGNNAYFVRKDKIGKLPVKSAEQGYVESKFRESRDEKGNLNFLHGKQRIECIRDMQVWDLEQNRLAYIRDLLNIG